MQFQEEKGRQTCGWKGKSEEKDAVRKQEIQVKATEKEPELGSLA